jgi:hypothetical protein
VLVRAKGCVAEIFFQRGEKVVGGDDRHAVDLTHGRAPSVVKIRVVERGR